MTDPIAQARTLRTTARGPRVMLVMPPRVASCLQPHLGLGILAARLAASGYSPLVVDYSYAEALPDIERFIREFEPHLIGVSMFSQNLRESERFIEQLNRIRPEVPIIVGGPHPSLADDGEVERIGRLKGVATVVRGEAERDIVDIAGRVLSDASPGVVNCGPVSLDGFCWPDFGLVMNGLSLATYPIQLSRGCPYRCSFCNIARMSGRKYRTRAVDDCIDEVGEAVHRYGDLQYVKVTDDAPNCLEARFEEFLEKYVERAFRPRLEVMQLRADHLTLRMCRLMKAARAPFVCLGVESADPMVFADVDKGETLEQIERACDHVRSCGIPLVLCFVLGLPGATRKTDMGSVAFARRMRPIHCYWNIAQPMPGTRMHEYFTRHGRIYVDNPMVESSLDGACFADTPEYPRKDRVDVQLIAQAATNAPVRSRWRLLRQAASRGVVLDVACALLTPRPRISPEIPRRW